MIFIPYNTPSSKNSKIATKRGVFHSKTVQKYLRELGIKHYSTSKKIVEYYKTKECKFPILELKKLFEEIEYPVKIGFHFVRKTKAKADFHNLVQLPLDIMTSMDIIPDDNMDYVFPQAFKIEGKFYSIDKNTPGVYIKILK